MPKPPENTWLQITETRPPFDGMNLYLSKIIGSNKGTITHVPRGLRNLYLTPLPDKKETNQDIINKILAFRHKKIVLSYYLKGNPLWVTTKAVILHCGEAAGNVIYVGIEYTGQTTMKEALLLCKRICEDRR